MSDWISCKERLPENNPDEELILCVSGKDGSITYDRAVVCGKFTVFEDDRFYICGCYLENVTIHAWMPLPEPYEGE